MTKTDIFSGFLGAGKTTLIQKLLREVFQGQKVALIENEFGEIGVDGGFLRESGVVVTEMNSGCICCSLVGDFGTALGEVMEKYHPDRILIEPSGVGKLSDVIRAVEQAGETADIAINSAVAVVDVKKARVYLKNFGEFYENQVSNASAIVLSRTQDVKASAVEDCVKLLRKYNPKAAIVTTPWEQISGERIFAAMEGAGTLREELLAQEEICQECGCHHEGQGHHHHDGACCQEGGQHSHGECCHEEEQHDSGKCFQKEGHHSHGNGQHDHDGDCCHHGEHHHHDGEQHHHHAEEVFTSWGIETPRACNEEELEAALKTLAHTDEYGKVLRAKGILPGRGGEWLYFDLVPGEYGIRKGAADYTGRICVIGTDIDQEGLAHLFSAQ